MKKTLGTMIAELRKQHGMTQLELAEILGVSVEELMQIKKEGEAPVSKVSQIIEFVPKAVAMAMGISLMNNKK